MSQIQFRTRKRDHEARDILFQIIQSEGLVTLTQLLKVRAKETQAFSQSAQSFATLAVNQIQGLFRSVKQEGFSKASKQQLAVIYRKTKHSWGKTQALASTMKQILQRKQQQFQGLSSPQARAQQLLYLGISSASFASGIPLGYLTPTKDLKFTRRNSPKSLITLYSASIFALNLSVEWTKAILQKAMVHPATDDTDREFFKKVNEAIEALSLGIAAGIGLGIFQKRALPFLSFQNTPIEIHLNDQDYQMLESLFASVVLETEAAE